MQLPTAIERFHVDSGNDEVMFDNQTIEILSFDDNKVELLVPQTLYQKILEYQAYNADNIRMDHTTNSYVPALTIKTTLVNELKKLADTLSRAIELDDSEQQQQQLAAITQQQIDTKNQLRAFLQEIDKRLDAIDDNAGIGDYRQVMTDISNAGTGLLSLDKQLIMLEFPDKVTSIDGFVTAKTESLQHQRTLSVDLDEYPYNNPDKLFVFHDISNDRYGLTDAKGNIRVAATYPAIRWQGKNYYGVPDKTLYRWNAAAETLDKVDGFNSFERSLGNGFDVLGKRVRPDGYDYDITLDGVVDKTGKTIIPVGKYDYIEHNENAPVTARIMTNDNDSIYDLYTDDLQPIDTPAPVAKARLFRHAIVARLMAEETDAEEEQPKKALLFFTKDGKPMTPPADIVSIMSMDEITDDNNTFTDDYFVAKDRDGNYALLDSQLKPITHFSYSYMYPLEGAPDYLVVSKKDTNYHTTDGLLDLTGKPVVPIIFNDIRYNLDDKKQSLPTIHYDIGDVNNEQDSMPLKQFLTTNWEARAQELSSSPIPVSDDGIEAYEEYEETVIPASPPQ